MRTARVAAGLLSVCLASALAMATGPQASSTFTVRHLDASDAVTLLYARVPGIGSVCRLDPHSVKEPLTVGVRGTIVMDCPPGADPEGWQKKVESALVAIDVAPPTYQFHVVILAASRKEGATPELPPSEAKALADFKKVMTFRSFRLEAETLVRTDRAVRVQMNNDYDLSVMLDAASTGGDAIHVQNIGLRSAHGQQTPQGSVIYPTYVDTSFDIRRGETIVLGGSISDQDARVVLVTALP